MKTLEQILEGVTAGGKWVSDSAAVWDERGQNHIGRMDSARDAAYASRSARNFHALVRALDLCATCLCGDERKRVAYETAKSALAEALKD